MRVWRSFSSSSMESGKSTGRSSCLALTEFDLDSISPVINFKDKFRFQKTDFRRLCAALGIPDEMRAPNRTRWSGLEGLCILLRRLAYPTRHLDLDDFFGRGKADISIIFNQMLAFLYRRWNRLFTDITEHARPGHCLMLDKLRGHAAAISVRAKGPLDRIWGFIDGTARPIARPTRGQRRWYSGHKRRHMPKFQAIVVPYGLIVHLYGPMEGQRHDSSILRMSGLMEELEQVPLDRANPGDMFALYGDSGYPPKLRLHTTFSGVNGTQVKRNHNAEMSSCRICVEWSFAEIRGKFAFLDLKANQRLLLQPVGMYFVDAALLVNCHTCLYRNETSLLFDLVPPRLEDYLV